MFLILALLVCGLGPMLPLIMCVSPGRYTSQKDTQPTVARILGSQGNPVQHLEATIGSTRHAQGEKPHRTCFFQVVTFAFPRLGKWLVTSEPAFSLREFVGTGYSSLSRPSLPPTGLVLS